MEDFTLGRLYQQSIERDSKKAHGKYYTPDYIIDFMLDKTLANANVTEKPFIKILDPACGCGFFLIKAYDMLKEKFREALPQLRDKYKDDSYWQEENLHYHILKHCLYGADIDRDALWLCSASLLTKDKNKYYDDLNIMYGDSLFRWDKYYDEKQISQELEEYRLIYGIKNLRDDKIEYMDRENAEEILQKSKFWSRKYDYIIGNPPYVGHKELTMDYKRWLLDEYKEVFRDKSDLSYCFYQRALETVADEGMITYISSRYFMESPTGRNLRKYLQNRSKIIQIVDFYGEEIFKGVGVATAIFFLSPDDSGDNRIEIWKYDRGKIKNIDSKDFQIFNVKQDKLLEDRWILISDDKRYKLDTIEAACKIRLKDIAESFQGIITGCDKAFIMDELMIKTLSIEEELLKPWIKNSHVDRYRVKESNLKLIYSDYIDEPLKYPNSIMHIEKYRDRLEQRRECKKGMRLWHQLQWGRIPQLFMKDKIVYPYKSKSNRFALDTKGCFCSADVYSFTLKDGVEGYTLPFLLGVLNSSIYEFYFKLFAKNMGSGVFDYYPNTVMELKIPDYEACKEIEPISIELTKLYEEGASPESIEALEAKIDSILAAYFGLKGW
ncbi:MAG: N-6 DNA methylase [Lutispora sp.]|nr:N-6 DNA methylase [Lutispora sp.]